jgi:hypothetical protein
MNKTKMTHNELIASVMASYTERLAREEAHRQAIRDAVANGTYQAPEGQWGEWNISDRD